MFGKLRCPKCDKKVSKNYSFCPYCGVSLKEGSEKFFEPAFNLGFPFNTILNKLVKQVEKELKDIDKNLEKPLLDQDEISFKPLVKGFSIKVDSSNGNPIIKLSSLNGKDRNAKEGKFNKKQLLGLNRKIDEKKAKELSKLPNEEPITSVRRLADKLVYEMDVPGVKKENVIIRKLQNSIEIKAFSKDRVYFKLIPLPLSIIKSKLEEGKLILELKP